MISYCIQTYIRILFQIWIFRMYAKRTCAIMHDNVRSIYEAYFQALTIVLKLMHVCSYLCVQFSRTKRNKFFARCLQTSGMAESGLILWISFS